MQLSPNHRIQRGQMAGFVLSLMGVFTYGATSPFALVLNAEWIKDPRRDFTLRNLDLTGFVLSIPGTAYFCFFSFAMFDYAPGGHSFSSLIAGYWVAFFLWLKWRSMFRWKTIRRIRNFSAFAEPDMYATHLIQSKVSLQLMQRQVSGEFIPSEPIQVDYFFAVQQLILEGIEPQIATILNEIYQSHRDVNQSNFGMNTNYMIVCGIENHVAKWSYSMDTIWQDRPMPEWENSNCIQILSNQWHRIEPKRFKECFQAEFKS